MCFQIGHLNNKSLMVTETDQTYSKNSNIVKYNKKVLYLNIL